MANDTGDRRYAGRAAEERLADRRARLLDAGLDLLADQGWQATTVTAVCAQARLTPRYFYESFTDRDELLLAIFDNILTEVADEVGAAVPPEPSMQDYIRAGVAAWVAVAMKDGRMGRVAFIEALGSEALMRRRLDATRGFAEMLSHRARTLYPAAPERRLTVAGVAVAGALVETMIEWIRGGLNLPPDTLVEDFTSLCTATFAAATATQE